MPGSVSMWGTYGLRPEPNHDLDELFEGMRAGAQIDIASTLERVWDLVSTVERIGEFSPECVEAWWVPDRPARVAGGRFEGRNRVLEEDGVREWIRPCDVLVWDPGECFSWTVGDRYDGTPSSMWSFSLSRSQTGVLVRQAFRHAAEGLSGLRHWAEEDPSRAPALVAQRTASLEIGMAATLARMKAVLEPS
jgi:uncharacterized protein YndB with AHSA1/START domain